MENPIKMDDLGAPPFSDLHMYCRPKLKWPTVADSTERMGRKKTLGFRFKAKLCMKATCGGSLCASQGSPTPFHPHRHPIPSPPLRGWTSHCVPTLAPPHRTLSPSKL